MSTSSLILIVVVVLAALAAAAVLAKRRGGLSKASPAKLAEIARSRASDYVLAHEKSTRQKLDYGRATLKALDQILEKNYSANTLSPSTIEEMGLYLGEVIRRTFGGEWRYNEGFRELCISNPAEGYIFPISQIRRALEQKETDHLQSYFDSIAERARAAG